MRVTLSTYAFPTYHHSFIEGHAVALAELGVDVHVASTARGDHELSLLGPATSGAISITSAPFDASRPRKVRLLAETLRHDARANPHELAALVRNLRQGSTWRRVSNRLYAMTPTLAGATDVVHVAWLPLAAASIDLLRAVRRPVVVTCNGADVSVDPLDNPEYEQRIREVFARVDVAHCVSRESADLAVSYGLDPSKVFHRSWGTDPRFFSPSATVTPRPSSELRVVSVGRVHWVKAYECALSALHELRCAGVDVAYSIFGEEDPKARHAVLTAVRDFGLEGRVRLHGAGTRVEIRDALRSSDVFVLTSLREGLCTAALEAMGVGLPVVVTDVGGMREAVDDGVEGFVVPSRDPSAVAHAIAKLAADPELRRTMGERGRERVVGHFDARDMSRKLADEYRRLVGRA